jgi:hypothetical protein
MLDGMKSLVARLSRLQPVLFLPLFSSESWERGDGGSGGLFATLTLSILVVVGLLLLVLAAARRLETNSEAARRAWNGGVDAASVPRARVVHSRKNSRSAAGRPAAG